MIFENNETEVFVSGLTREIRPTDLVNYFLNREQLFRLAREINPYHPNLELRDFFGLRKYCFDRISVNALSGILTPEETLGILCEFWGLQEESRSFWV